MKQTLRSAPISLLPLRRPFRLRRQSLQQAVWFFSALVLASLRIAGRTTPLAVCLLTVADWPVLAASALGGVSGYCLEFGGQALEPVGAAMIVLAARLLIRDRTPGFWFAPTVCAAAWAAAGLFCAALEQFLPLQLLWTCLHAAAALGGTLICRRALCYHRKYDGIALAVGVLGGLCCIPGGRILAPGVLAFTVMLCAAVPEGLILAAAGGATLETLLSGGAYTMVFCLCSLLAMLLAKQPAMLRSACMACLCLVLCLLPQAIEAAAGAAAVVGFALASPLPQLRMRRAEQTMLPDSRLLQCLHDAGQTLEQACTLLGADRPDSAEPDAAVVFDRAAEQVCRCCVSWSSCWERDAAQTYEDLCACAEPMLANGALTAEDLPERFFLHCQHTDGFLTAINRELDDRRYLRRCRIQARESRRVLAGQYAVLGRFLRQTAEHPGKIAPGEANFAPDISARTCGRAGHSLSGDRGACFAGQGTDYYILLCDGMGTGTQAAQESAAAVDLLTGLLQAGMDPADALRTLNGLYLLRDNGCFATVDLLRINLVSGDALLFKWGAAASYLKRRKGVRRLGGGELPPGVSAGQEPVQHPLNLSRGELLVLTSDGAGGEETERRIAGYDSLSPLELTAYIIAGAQMRGDDDMSAVAVRLRPLH